jgi:hypothetical protein
LQGSGHEAPQSGFAVGQASGSKGKTPGIAAAAGQRDGEGLEELLYRIFPEPVLSPSEINFIHLEGDGPTSNRFITEGSSSNIPFLGHVE